METKRIPTVMIHRSRDRIPPPFSPSEVGRCLFFNLITPVFLDMINTLTQGLLMNP